MQTSTATPGQVSGVGFSVRRGAAAGGATALDRPAIPSLQLPDSWMCNGLELKPRVGANSRNTWIAEGEEIHPVQGASDLNTWVWNGRELRPKVGAGPANTWVFHGSKVRLKCSTRLADSYDVAELPVLAVAGKLALRLF